VTVTVKICGINDFEALEAAVEGGADMVGFVFHPSSPRSVEPELAAELADILPDEVTAVGLFVDADDAAYDRVLGRVRLDLIQCHGKESPERVEAIRLEYGVPVMKAIPIETARDFDAVTAYLEVADRLLFDTKQPKEALLPGGGGVSFDWSLLSKRRYAVPWMLAGGLNAGNVAEAIRISKAKAVDVSSGVEVKPGKKDPEKIRVFIIAAKGG